MDLAVLPRMASRKLTTGEQRDAGTARRGIEAAVNDGRVFQFPAKYGKCVLASLPLSHKSICSMQAKYNKSSRLPIFFKMEIREPNIIIS